MCGQAKENRCWLLVWHMECVALKSENSGLDCKSTDLRKVPSPRGKCLSRCAEARRQNRKVHMEQSSGERRRTSDAGLCFDYRTYRATDVF